MSSAKRQKKQQCNELPCLLNVPAQFGYFSLKRQNA